MSNGILTQYYWSWFVGVVFGIMISGGLLKLNTDKIDVNYNRCVVAYEDCNINDLLSKLSENGEILLGNYVRYNNWYIRYEVQVDSNIEYKFKSDDKLTPEDALYDLIVKMNKAGIEL